MKHIREDINARDNILIQLLNEKKEFEQKIKQRLIQLDNSLGPQTKKLHQAFNKIGITEQIYFFSLTGNMVRRLLQRIDDVLIDLDPQLFCNPIIIRAAEAMKLMNKIQGK